MFGNIFRRLFQQSLIVKISLIIIVTTTMFLVAFGYYQYRSSSQQMTQELQQTIDLTANRLAISLRAPLYQYSTDIVTEILQSEMQSEMVAGIVIAQQEKFSGFVRNPVGELVPTEATLSEADYLTARGIIKEAEEVIGEVAVFGTRTALEQALRELWQLTVIQIVIIDFVLVVILTLLIHMLFLVPLKAIIAFVKRVAEGDLTAKFDTKRHDEIGVLAKWFQTMIDKLTEVVASVKVTATQVALESRSLQTNMEQMSQGATEQASVAEETSSSMQEMAANIRQNVDNAIAAEKIAKQSAVDARHGGNAVGETVTAMQAIEERIAVIQQIALQTHLLSLNATLEAAKAQDFGKGFAVVAAEVRSLAGNSRTAAEEIEKLVKSSVFISEKAGQILQHLVPNSEKTSELVQEVLAASKEQLRGADLVNVAVQQIDTVIQQNVANTEQLSSSAESLAIQAENLQQLIAFFTVPEQQQVKEETDKRQLAINALQQLLTGDALDDDTVTDMLAMMSSSKRPKKSHGAASPKNPPNTTAHAQHRQQEQRQPVSLDMDGGRDELDDDFEKF